MHAVLSEAGQISRGCFVPCPFVLQYQGRGFRPDKYSILDAACVQLQFMYELLVEVGPSLGWADPVEGALVHFSRKSHPPSGVKVWHPNRSRRAFSVV